VPKKISELLHEAGETHHTVCPEMAWEDFYAERIVAELGRT
jgi:hypothetical protein